MRRKVQKVWVELNSRERKLLIDGMMRFRNKVIRAGGPTEDIDELLLRIIKL